MFFGELVMERLIRLGRVFRKHFFLFFFLHANSRVPQMQPRVDLVGDVPAVLSQLVLAGGQVANHHAQQLGGGLLPRAGEEVLQQLVEHDLISRFFLGGGGELYFLSVFKLFLSFCAASTSGDNVSLHELETPKLGLDGLP